VLLDVRQGFEVTRWLATSMQRRWGHRRAVPGTGVARGHHVAVRSVELDLPRQRVEAQLTLYFGEVLRQVLPTDSLAR